MYAALPTSITASEQKISPTKYAYQTTKYYYIENGGTNRSSKPITVAVSFLFVKVFFACSR